jgi:predicted lipoprotein with Yx(FWY)xxD motif
MIAYKDEVGGRYLTNAYGFTLYEFTNDTQGSGVSACVGTCEINWPPFYVQSIDAPSLVSRAQFDYITLNSGNKEVTYSGWPLHYFADDLKPGETNGQGFLDVWFAMMPMTP